MNAALKIKAVRTALKISQKQLANLLKIKQNTLSMIELGNNNCALDHVEKLFDLLNVSPIWFFQDKGEMFTCQADGKESDAQWQERACTPFEDYLLQRKQIGWLTKPFLNQQFEPSAEQITQAETPKDKADLLEALIVLEEFAGRKTEELRNELAYTDAALLVISQHINQKYPLEKLNIDCRLQHERTQLAHIQIINL